MKKESGKKVIFLDVDGVLNNFDDILNAKDAETDIELPQDKHLKVLKEIVDKTGADIVLSSGWRLASENLQEAFDALLRFNLTLRGVTPEGVDEDILLSKGIDVVAHNVSCMYDGTRRNYERGAEIAAWLIKHSEYTNILIIDDEVKDIKEYFPNNYLLINPNKGLLPEHVEKGVEILNKTV